MEPRRHYAPHVNPEDAFGEEVGDNARVWRAYRDEVTNHDTALLQSWNRTLDVLLIFSGLFSAVSTTFIVDSYKSLQPDAVTYMADVLFAIASAQNNSHPALRRLKPLEDLSATNNSRWVNALWLVSLVLSMAVALVCILAKQWLQTYQARISAPAQSAAHWVRRHVLFSEGLRVWRVDAIISALPAALHLALFLFLSGLVIFAFPLDCGISYVLLGITLALAVLYACSMIIPLWSAACPFRTALATQILDLWCTLHERSMTFTARITTWVLTTYLRSSFPLAKYVQHVLEFVDTFARRELMTRTSHWTWADQLAELRTADLSARALKMLVRSPSQHVASMAVQAIGSLHPSSRTINHLMRDDSDTFYDILARLSQAFNEIGSSSFDPHAKGRTFLLDYARFLRTTIVLSKYWTGSWGEFNIRWSSYFLAYWRGPQGTEFDLGLLEGALNWMITGRHEPFMALVQGTEFNLHAQTSAYAVCALLLNESIEHPRDAIAACLRLLQVAGSLGKCSDPDLAFIYASFASALRALDVDLTFLGQRAEVPSLICIELWSVLLTEDVGPSLPSRTLDRMMLDIGDLIESLRKRAHPDAFRISDIRHLLQLFISPLMPRSSWPQRTIVLSLGLLKDVYRVELQNSEEHVTPPNFWELVEDLHRAVGVLGSLATSSAPDISSVEDLNAVLKRPKGAFWAADWFGVLVDRKSGHPRMAVRGTRELSVIGTEFLLRREDNGSLWQTIVDLDCEPKRLFVLAGVLSTSLCAMRRQGLDITSSLAVFYHDGVWVTDCIRMAYSLRTVGAADAWHPWSLAQFEQLALHCAELSDDWEDYCSMVAHDEKASKELCDFASEMGDVLRARGQCTLCV